MTFTHSCGSSRVRLLLIWNEAPSTNPDLMIWENKHLSDKSLGYDSMTVDGVFRNTKIKNGREK